MAYDILASGHPPKTVAGKRVTRRAATSVVWNRAGGKYLFAVVNKIAETLDAKIDPGVNAA